MKQETYVVSNSREENGDYELVFEGDLGIKNITSIKKSLALTEFRECNVRINFRNVEKLDLSTIQILDSYKRTLNDNGCKTVVSAVFPEDLQGLILKSGLSSIFK
jgi:ABC-type transporter Mla MlaB component